MATRRTNSAWLCLPVIVALAVSAVACDIRIINGGNSVEETRRLEEILPTLQTLGFTRFDDDSSCKSLVYARGTFVENRSLDGCDPIDGTQKPFDEQANQDLATVESALAKTGFTVLYARATNADGVLLSAMFEVGCESPCSYGSYQYQRGGIEIHPDLIGLDEVTVTRMTEDWLWYEEIG